MDTEKILSKITTKDYHNELEIILEDKDFSEDVKNLLLSCVYKIEAGYQDYERVKQTVVNKREYLEEILTIIKEKCHHIEIQKELLENSENNLENRYEVDRLEGNIILRHPNEKILLYAIYELDDKQIYVDEKYSLIRTSLSELLNKGENINRLEVLRDFNGWNWNTNFKEIPNVTINLVYQNFISLLGSNFMAEWIHAQELKDYLELAKRKIEEQFGKENEQKIFGIIAKLAILTCVDNNEKEKQFLLEEKQELEGERKRLNNKIELLEQISKNRKEAFSQIREIDTILNDKKLLEKEYKKRNEQLSKYHKVINLAHLMEILTKQRRKIVAKMEEEKKILEPANYVKTKNKLEKNLELLFDIDLTKEAKRKKIIANSILLQKVIMNCFLIKIQKIDELEKPKRKEELIKAIYEFRYYCYLYLENEKYIGNTEELKEQITEIQTLLLQKLEELKYINRIAKDRKKNFEIVKLVFSTRIINLENIVLEMKQEEKIQVLIYETDTLEEQISLEMNKEDLTVKLDKKIKLFG